MKIDASAVSLTNVPSGYTAEVASDKAGEVKLSGLGATLNTIKAADLAPVIDVGAWLEAHNETIPITLEYEIPAEYSMPKNVEFKSGTSFIVTLTPIAVP